MRGPLYPHEPTCSGCPQSKYAASAPSLAASAGLALPRSREGKSRPARDATHTSGLFEFNSEILRMNQAHRSGADKRQGFDHPPPVKRTARKKLFCDPTNSIEYDAVTNPYCSRRSDHGVDPGARELAEIADLHPVVANECPKNIRILG